MSCAHDQWTPAPHLLLSKATLPRHSAVAPDDVVALGQHEKQGNLAQGRGGHALLLHLPRGAARGWGQGQDPSPYWKVKR